MNNLLIFTIIKKNSLNTLNYFKCEMKTASRWQKVTINKWVIDHLNGWLQFFSVALVHFSHHYLHLHNIVQPPQHLVICAHHSSSFSFLQTNWKCFWTCINCFHTTLCCFITLSFAYVMSVKINYTCEWWIVIPYKTNSPHFIAWVITYKNVELDVKICQANFKNF